jgi:DNA-binding NarL/FixJ family response regulator
MAVFSATPTPMAAKARGAVNTNITPSSNDDHLVKLTKREVEVLTHVVQGRSSKEVADTLFVSKRTVDFHLANIYDKLHVSNRVQAFRRATKLGLIPYEAQFVD